MIFKILISVLILFVVLFLLNTLIARFVFKLFLTRSSRISLTNEPVSNDQKLLPSNCENITITAEDGIKLNGYVSVVSDNAPFAIFIHGFGDSARALFNQMRRANELGYNVFIPDLRSCGLSEGQFCGLSKLEVQDLNLWVDLLISKYNMGEFYIHGESFGGTISLRYAASNNNTNLKGVFIDSSPYALEMIAMRVLSWRIRYPWKLLRPTLDWFIKRNIGFSLDESNILNELNKITVPVHMIYGKKDGLIPPEIGQKIYDTIKSEKKITFVEEASHLGAKKVDPELYINCQNDFLKAIFN